MHFSTALSQILQKISCVELLNIYENGSEAINGILAFEPCIVIVDIKLKGELSGLDIIKQTKDFLPKTEFLICTVNDDDQTIFEALSLGASGYILKNSTMLEIKNAIVEVIAGGAPMSPFIARKVISSFRSQQINTPKEYYLTNREQEVLSLLSKGLLYKEIANQLSITHSTVKKHIRNIYEKLHVQNKVEAINKFR